MTAGAAVAASPARRGVGPGRVAVVLCLTLAGLLAFGAARSSGHGAPDLQQRANSVAAGLRCPTCEGQSVAVSESDLAREMRGVIDDQLRAGRSPAQVRAWFAQRYGDSVLLDPPWRGAGALLQVVPVAVLLGATAAIVARRRHRRLGLGLAGGAVALPVAAVVWSAATAGSAPPAAATAASAGSTSVGPSVRTSVGPSTSTGQAAPDTRTADADAARALALERQGDLTAAAAEYRAALTAAPSDRVAVRLALVLLRLGRPRDAAVLGDRLVASGSTADGLLVRGLAQRAQGSAAATATLRAFLAAAPDHPAAAEVRRLLGGSR